MSRELDELIAGNARRRDQERHEREQTQGLADEVRQRTSARPPEDRAREAQDQELKERLRRLGVI